MHDRKSTDYGAEHDPLANIRASEEWGIPAWVGAMVRANDKVHRLKRFAERGSLANESVEDSLLDIAVYSLIALVLYREQSASRPDPEMERLLAEEREIERAHQALRPISGTELRRVDL